MIYLNHNDQKQLLYVPKTREGQGILSLKAVNTITKGGFVEHLDDYGTSQSYHVFSIALPNNVLSGEYQYELSDVNGVLSSGILVIGKESGFVEYQNMTEYEQYEK